MKSIYARKQVELFLDEEERSIQEEPNRILSKVQKSFLSCTHVNSCQNHILYINLQILLNI